MDLYLASFLLVALIVSVCIVHFVTDVQKTDTESPSGFSGMDVLIILVGVEITRFMFNYFEPTAYSGGLQLDYELKRWFMSIISLVLVVFLALCLKYWARDVWEYWLKPKIDLARWTAGFD